MAVNEKTPRRSANGDAPPVHMLSAFSTRFRLVLGEENVTGNSNEITAIAILLKPWHIRGLLVSIGAIGCQREMAAEELAKTVRAHWAIENRFHWMLDVCFGETDGMIRKNNALQNLSLLEKSALNLLRVDKTDTAKTGLRLKHKRAAWDEDARMKMLGTHPLQLSSVVALRACPSF